MEIHMDFKIIGTCVWQNVLSGLPDLRFGGEGAKWSLGDQQSSILIGLLFSRHDQNKSEVVGKSLCQQA